MSELFGISDTNCGLAESILAIIFFSIFTGWLPTNFAKLFSNLFGCKTKEQIMLAQINAQIREVRSRMSELSPTVDFAKYFKCERTLKKLEEEQSKLDRTIASNSFISSLKYNMLIRFIFMLLSLMLIWHSNGGFMCTNMDSKWLFPLKFLMPVQILNHAFGGTIAGTGLQESGQHTITFFDFSIMVILVKKIYNYYKH